MRSLQKLYKLNWDESKATGYQLNHEYLPLLNAKRARDSVSDVSITSVSFRQSTFHVRAFVDS